MGFTQSIVLASCSFILGMVFVCQVVDIPLLYMPVTEQALQNAYDFYEMWWEAPGAVKALFHVALALPMLALIFKLNRWTESAMFFDGSGVVMHLATIVLYLTVHIQSLRTFPERTEAVRVLAAANALVGLLTLGVIGMQVGQEYARRVEEREQREVDRAAVVQEGKKDI
ncbi:hypothetical protein EHS25_005236 [Saitozyma podzolica]|uniref:Uncharacterized protein n=1 Tax=Saitozyma podzolica TaxID=1890683 RepID=A0A427XYT6_9TREE|nr:hypothetical protein EHS25_005236 [Saitozyma podzolica]